MLIIFADNAHAPWINKNIPGQLVKPIPNDSLQTLSAMPIAAIEFHDPIAACPRPSPYRIARLTLVSTRRTFSAHGQQPIPSLTSWPAPTSRSASGSGIRHCGFAAEASGKALPNRVPANRSKRPAGGASTADGLLDYTPPDAVRNLQPPNSHPPKRRFLHWPRKGLTVLTAFLMDSVAFSSTARLPRHHKTVQFHKTRSSSNNRKYSALIINLI